MDTYTIINSLPEHAEQQTALMERVYGVKQDEPDSELFSPAQFRRHIELFPHGQFVALYQGRVIGLTVSMMLPFDPAKPFIEPWFTTIDNGWLHKHDPTADWMYGVESCVDNDFHSRGIGGALMDARFNVARDLNLRGMVAGSGLISYRQNTEKYGPIKPDDYIRRVVAGELFDTNLTKQIKKGFKPLAVIPNYLRDSESMGWGAVIVWDNPDYDPSRRRGEIVPRQYTLPMRKSE